MEPTMAWIRTTCPGCGDVYLPIGKVDACVELPAVRCSYRFACPHCGTEHDRDCSPAIIDRLVAGGVQLRTTTVLHQPGDAASPPPLTHDDLDGFLAALYEPETFRRALAELTAGRDPGG
jgi:hypothetical protein